MSRALVKEIKDTHKNYIINGDMRIAQRGTSFAAVGSLQYTLDRFRYVKVGAMVHTITQDTDVPTLAQAGYLFQNSLRLNLTTPDTSIATSDTCYVQHFVEGYNWANLAQKIFTVSFWVKATLPGIYSLAAVNLGGDRINVAEYTINATATWEYKSVTFSASPSAGTWSYTTGVGINLAWILATGTDNTTSNINTWNTTVDYASTNQINGVNTGATDFRITGVMLSEGVSAPTFRTFGEDFEAELAACMRYYEKSYSLTQTVPANDIAGCHQFLSRGVGSEQCAINFAASKRIVPTMIVYSTNNSATGVAYNVTDAVNVAYLAENTGTNGTGFAGAIVANKLIRFQWTADAEL